MGHVERRVAVEERRRVDQVGLGQAPAAGPARRRRPPRGTGRSCRGRGSGSASAVTMTSWSALATMTRSTGSVSSAVRRSVDRARLDPHDAGQRVRSRRRRRRPAPTRSPTTTLLRPSSRAFIAVTMRSRPSSPAAASGAYRPRSTPVHDARATASVVRRGRGSLGAASVSRSAGAGATADVATSSDACCRLTGSAARSVAGAPSISVQSPVNSGRVLAVVADVLDLDAGHAQPEHRAGRRHPVVVVGLRRRPPCSGRGRDQQAVARSRRRRRRAR